MNPFEKKKKMSKTIIFSLISTFSALNIIADLLPTTPVIGLPGAYFRLGWILAPLTGIILGPTIGGVSCVLASLVELLIGLQSWSFGILSPLRAGFSAFQAGLLVKKRWKLSFIIIILLIFSWVLMPTGQEAYIILFFPIVGALLILFLRSRIGKYIDSSINQKVALAFVVASYCGNISRYMLGNSLLVLTTNMPSIVFISALPLTLIEQISFAAVATVIGVSLIRTPLKEFIDFH